MILCYPSKWLLGVDCYSDPWLFWDFKINFFKKFKFKNSFTFLTFLLLKNEIGFQQIKAIQSVYLALNSNWNNCWTYYSNMYNFKVRNQIKICWPKKINMTYIVTPTDVQLQFTIKLYVHKHKEMGKDHMRIIPHKKNISYIISIHLN